MKISDLIDQLTSIKEKNGDIEILLSNYFNIERLDVRLPTLEEAEYWGLDDVESKIPFVHLVGDDE